MLLLSFSQIDIYTTRKREHNNILVSLDSTQREKKKKKKRVSSFAITSSHFHLQLDSYHLDFLECILGMYEAAQSMHDAKLILTVRRNISARFNSKQPRCNNEHEMNPLTYVERSFHIFLHLSSANNE